MNPVANILIVDDTPENLTVLRDILTRSGYRVRPVLQGALAVKSAQTEPPDLILLDIMMPGMDGYETCTYLKADPRTRDVPVLFISALDATESKVRGFELGALDYILKPFRAEEVLARVRTHLSLHAAQRQLKAQNEELLQAARLREDVDHMLRHDLRGPLGNMISFAELIREEAAPGSKLATHAQTITDAGYALLNMVHASFDLMKMERGDYQLKPEVFDVLEIVRQVIAELRLAAGAKGAYFDLSFADSSLADLVVVGEPLLCHSLFYNLAKNAIEASPVGGQLRFSLGRQDQMSVIRLRNAGAVPESIRARFFDKYVTHGKAGGTGLGTYSARLMAETQSGQIALDCAEPGFTTITVRLPSAGEAEVARFRAERAQSLTAQSARAEAMAFPAADLLIADDDAANRAYLQHILPAPPLRLHFAADGQEALHILQTKPVTIALLDIEMPCQNGLEVARAYQEWLRDLPTRVPTAGLIAFSGHQDEETLQQCRQAGFNRLLPKPTTKDTLYAVLREVLQAQHNVVRVDPAIASLIPDFLNSQRQNAAGLEQQLQARDVLAVGSLAHRLQGSLAMYGFDRASRIATGISEAAKAGDLDRASPLVSELRAHLNSVEVVYQ